MSAKDAPGEVKDKNRQNIESSPNFDKSPNISSADDEEQKAIAAAKAAQKESETILIDGIPISADEIKYKASDIKKKGKTEYFVNVEGAEERKKAAIKKAREDALAAERRVKEAKEAAAKAEADRKAQAELKAAEEKRRAKADDERVIGELKKKASVRKKENRIASRREKRFEKKERKRLFFQKNKRKIIIIAIITVVVIACAIYAATYLQKRYVDTRIEEATAAANEMVKEGAERLKNDTSDTPEDNLREFYESKIAESKDEYDRQLRLLKYASALAQQVRRYDLSNQTLDRLVDEFPEYKDNCDVLYLYQSNYIWLGTDTQSMKHYDEVINNKCISDDEV